AEGEAGSAGGSAAVGRFLAETLAGGMGAVGAVGGEADPGGEAVGAGSASSDGGVSGLVSGSDAGGEASGGWALGAPEGGGAGSALPPAAPTSLTSSVPITVPWLTLSPKWSRSSFKTPPCEAGTSIEALSDSSVIRLCSALMVSPGLTSSSMTEASVTSPMSGTLSSMRAMWLTYAYSGLILSAWMAYLAMASATRAGGNEPSSARALSAATTM